jgi:hypothetical protein
MGILQALPIDLKKTLHHVRFSFDIALDHQQLAAGS